MEHNRSKVLEKRWGQDKGKIPKEDMRVKDRVTEFCEINHMGTKAKMK